jgi:hypothetical protein
LRTKPFLLLALVVGILWAPASPAADLGASVTLAPSEAHSLDRRATTLSNLLSLLLVRVTFDVMAIEDVLGRVEDRIIAWGGDHPSDGERDEIERQLLAEASYYIVSLRYLIQVGGAAFPSDRPESDYANDTLVRLDSLERKLFDQIAAHEDVEEIIREVEAIRLLTEGSAEMTSGEGYFAQHQNLLEAADRLSRLGLPT